MKTLMVLLSLILLPLQPAHAIDAGAAKGALKAGGKDVALNHAIAYQLDNAEGLLDRPREMRIALTDREVPQSALAGIAFPPVTQLAREGKVQGLLLRFDPADRKSVYVTYLAAPSDPRMSLTTLTIGGTQEAFRKLEIANNRVTGEIAHKESRAGSADMPALEFDIQFSAPQFNDPPVTADLKGEAARKSPQAQLLVAKARALAAGDFDALRRISTERANRNTDMFLKQMGDKAAVFAKEAGRELLKINKSIERVVERGDRAVMIIGKGEWMTFVRVGGQWLTDD